MMTGFFALIVFSASAKICSVPPGSRLVPARHEVGLGWPCWCLTEGLGLDDGLTKLGTVSWDSGARQWAAGSNYFDRLSLQIPRRPREAGRMANFSRLGALLRTEIGTLLLAFALATPAAAADEPPPAGRRRRLADPRFVSLKSDRVNLRTPEHRLPHRMVLAGRLPLEIVKSSRAGAECGRGGRDRLVLQSFLSGRRAALVLPWEVKPDTPRPQLRSARATAPGPHARHDRSGGDR